MFLRLLSLGLTYDGALADATTVCKRLCRVDTLSVDLLRPTSAWFSVRITAAWFSLRPFKFECHGST